MFREFFFATQRRTASIAWVGVLMIICHALFNAWLKRRLNEWYGEFYSFLQTAPSFSSGEFSSGAEQVSREGRAQVSEKLWQFWLIVLPMLIVHPVVKYLRSLWALEWRFALMRRYIFSLNPSSPMVEGASQRTQEDTQRFANGLQGALVVVLDAVCTLAVFLPLLHELGGEIQCPPLFKFLGDFWLVYLASSSAALGLMVSVYIGKPLVGLEVQNQVVEAEYRKELVLLETSSSNDAALTNNDAALCRSAVFEPNPVFAPLLDRLRANYVKLFKNFMFLNAWVGFFDQALTLMPYAVAAPLLFFSFPHQIKLGLLVQLSNSFGKVFDALNVVSENWVAVNEFASCVIRLRQFERSLRMTSRVDTLLAESVSPSEVEM